MDGMVIFLNTTGKSFVAFSTSMLIQSSVLIIILLVLDVFLRKRVRVAFLYGIWMLVLIKLLLPTTLGSPVGLGHWLGDKAPRIIAEKASSIPRQIASILQRTRPASPTIPYGMNITDLSVAGISPEPPAGPASPATNSLSWQGLVFLGWLTVVIAMVSLLIRRMFFVRGLLAQSKNPNDSMVGVFQRCRRQMAVHRPVFLGLCPLAVSPSACGIFRPAILIPQNLPCKLKADDLRSILLHELAHIKRGDVWISLIQTMLQIAYFYNPLLWVANGIIRKVREQAVDEMVLVALGEQAEDYPQTLLNISRMTFGRPTLNLRLIGVVESRKALERRIVTMLSRPVPKSSRLGYLRLITIVVIGAMLLPMGRNAVAEAAKTQENIVANIIVPGLRVGDYTFSMSKDDIVKRLGKPKVIFYGDEKYTLDDLPKQYFMHFGDLSFHILDDSVKGITVLSPSYKLPNGLRVGDSEQKIKQAFGDGFQLKETQWKDFLSYQDEGLMFEINKQDRTVMEINVSPVPGSESYKKADIPATSHIDEQGRLVDKVDYPFVNDPKVIGGWKSVDFVREINQFNPAEKSWKGGLHLNYLIFEEGGKILRSGLTWTKGLVMSEDTASKYLIKEMGGSSYMFYEWKSGDYTRRYMKPFYYVLKKVPAESLKYEPMYGKKADIPPTSTINEQGRIVDKIDYPLVNDPQVIGTWKSVDFVDEMEEFKPSEKQWEGSELYLKELIFLPDGKTAKPWWTWTKGLVFHSGDKTASKYTLKDIEGSTYMFFEWKSGDYTIRYRKPSYYVLKKVSSETE